MPQRSGTSTFLSYYSQFLPLTLGLVVVISTCHDVHTFMQVSWKKCLSLLNKEAKFHPLFGEL